MGNRIVYTGEYKMSDCCAVTTDALEGNNQAAESSPEACGRCRDAGREVEHRTMLQVLKPDRFERLGTREFRFCQTPSCSIIYYSTDGEVAFSADDLRVKVGLKMQGDSSAQVCYCFGYTEGMMADELRATGRTVIPHKITELIKTGMCACEARNPAGVCCLGQVNKAVKRLSEEGKASTEASLAQAHDCCSR